ncbi:4-hydroxybenzoate polyprenyltransferase [Nocardioides terrae]|uniref:4-hydroxybenzoate polyprenyltransferase n=1 Tax=Nocardioides terrae TaxID=574651 RepID=A0A1I1EDK5_9ACTN|nr:UbiA family prenyltransferase [Nocardioides terrae]SFB84856.1 4-hydroxybenzoate polyprenyltransferase [Nocardioides terrae]
MSEDPPETVPSESSPPAPPAPADPVRPGRPHRRLLLDSVPVLLVRAAHPRQALLTAAGLAAVAALDARPGREVALVAATVLIGQVVLGWHNDLVDRVRDRDQERPGKPLADGRLDPGTTWFAWCCGVLLLVPLAVNNGVLAGACYLASVAVGLLGNLDNGLVRRGLLSWLPWAVSFGLYPAFLSYGGWGGQAEGDPPQPVLLGLAALVGVGVHFLTALWGLVADDAEGWTYLPLRAGRRLGATRLLAVTLVYLAAAVAAFAVVAHQLGLSR